MSFRVIIERKFKEPITAEILEVVDGIRIKALRHRGYIGGETMVNVEDDRELIVISSWSNVDDWKIWYDTKEWKELEKKLAPHLQESVRIRVFMPGADHEARVSPK
ncbi:MAG: antibiotic biosynthesis monooxygenase [Desulfobacteraceae bacterium]|jgi:heme-degrading monooxygenase HmoA